MPSNTKQVWLYKGKPFTKIPEGAVGFVYSITHFATGKSYIGKRSFYSHTTKRVKGKKNRKHTIKESDWQNYWSSSAEIKDAVKAHGKSQFIREILKYYRTKSAVSYGELEYQVKLDVLTAKLPDGSDAFYNGNIMSRYSKKAELRNILNVKRKQLISSDEATPSNVQHTKPCWDCPFRRKSISGWLGGNTPQEFLALAHGDEIYPCHTQIGPQCAGMAIYRKNIAKFPRDSKALRLPVDKKSVFASSKEFLVHHSR